MNSMQHEWRRNAWKCRGHLKLVPWSYRPTWGLVGLDGLELLFRQMRTCWSQIEESDLQQPKSTGKRTPLPQNWHKAKRWSRNCPGQMWSSSMRKWVFSSSPGSKNRIGALLKFRQFMGTDSMSPIHNSECTIKHFIWNHQLINEMIDLL